MKKAIKRTMVMAALVLTMAVLGSTSALAKSLGKPVNVRQTKKLTICVGEEAALHIFNSEKERKNHSLKVGNTKVLKAVEKRNAGNGTDALIKGLKAGNSKVTATVKKSAKSVKKITLTVKVRRHSYDKAGRCRYCGQRKKNAAASNGRRQSESGQAPLIEEHYPQQVTESGNGGASFLTSQTSVRPVADNLSAKFASLKSKYPEGMPWGNSKYYRLETNRSLPVDENGLRIADLYACAAFAFGLNEEACGKGDYYQHNNVNKIQVGDVVRMNRSHWVIVIAKSGSGFTVAEGNMNGAVHWGRYISYSEMLGGMNVVNTKYPQ